MVCTGAQPALPQTTAATTIPADLPADAAAAITFAVAMAGPADRAFAITADANAKTIILFVVITAMSLKGLRIRR